MSAFLSFDAVSARTPDHTLLFSGLTLSVGRERVGLVGRNGVGKSTLLRIAAGMSVQSAGTVRRSGTIATLAQAWPDAACLAEALGVAGALARIDRIIAGQAGNGDLDDVDWSLPGRIDGVLSGIGLADIGLDRPVGTLSGGERMRVAIAGLTMTAPDLLLLDEPTNSLDDAGREAIASLLRTHAGGALVASHDRALLDGMDRIVELTSVGVRITGGGWSAFASARDAERARTEAALERAEAALEDARRTAQAQREARERRDKAGRADAARGSAPKIALDRRAERAERSGGQTRRLGADRIVAAEAGAEQARSRLVVTAPFAVSLPRCGIPPAHLVLELREAVVDRGACRLGPWSLALRGPERVAVVGRNGAGKSTLMQLAAGLLQPDMGAVVQSDRIALLDQHATLLVGPDTVLANLRRCDPSLGEREAHAACARFGFRNRAADRSVDALSGGERLRAALCCVLGVARPPWLLLLDEPTNHLDLEAIAVLEAALHGFDGALLVASHDAAFLDAIGIGRRYAV